MHGVFEVSAWRAVRCTQQTPSTWTGLWTILVIFQLLSQVCSAVDATYLVSCCRRSGVAWLFLYSLLSLTGCEWWWIQFWAWRLGAERSKEEWAISFPSVSFSCSGMLCTSISSVILPAGWLSFCLLLKHVSWSVSVRMTSAGVLWSWSLLLFSLIFVGHLSISWRHNQEVVAYWHDW